MTYRQRPTKQARKRGKAKASIDAEENDQSIAGPSSRRTRAIRPVELPDDPIQEDETWDDSADYQDPDYMRGFEESNVIDLRSEDGDDVQVVEATNDEGEGIDPADRHGQCYEALKQLRDEVSSLSLLTGNDRSSRADRDREEFGSHGRVRRRAAASHQRRPTRGYGDVSLSRT